VRFQSSLGFPNKRFTWLSIEGEEEQVAANPLAPLMWTNFLAEKPFLHDLRLEGFLSLYSKATVTEVFATLDSQRFRARPFHCLLQHNIRHTTTDKGIELCVGLNASVGRRTTCCNRPRAFWYYGSS
jgi:hypothetical protein